MIMNESLVALFFTYVSWCFLSHVWGDRSMRTEGSSKTWVKKMVTEGNVFSKCHGYYGVLWEVLFLLCHVLFSAYQMKDENSLLLSRYHP